MTGCCRTTPTTNIRAILLLPDAHRPLKAIAAWGDGVLQLDQAGIPSYGPGIRLGESLTRDFTRSLANALGRHRVWACADLVMAGAIPPSA